MKKLTRLISLVIAFALLLSMAAFAEEGAEAGQDAQYAEHLNVIAPWKPELPQLLHIVSSDAIVAEVYLVPG